MQIELSRILFNHAGKCPYCSLEIRGSDVLRRIEHYQGPCVAMMLIVHSNYDLAARAYFHPVLN